MEPEDRARSFVAAAVQHKVTLERLRVARADLATGKWWPLPERRAMLDEIAQLSATLDRLEARLADEDGARATASLMIDAAVAEVAATGLAPERMSEQVVARLSLPGRPLAVVDGLNLEELPGVAEHLTLAAVRRQVSLAGAH